MDPKERGRRGEAVAAAFLRRRGWKILSRNERVGRRELDLVVYRDGVLAFVEVKSRGGVDFGTPLEALTWKKRQDVMRAASEWLLQRHLPSTTTIRFDAVGVTWTVGGECVVEHVEDAWRRL
jgi:putative endonuclease